MILKNGSTSVHVLAAITVHFFHQFFEITLMNRLTFSLIFVGKLELYTNLINNP